MSRTTSYMICMFLSLMMAGLVPSLALQSAQEKPAEVETVNKEKEKIEAKVEEKVEAKSEEKSEKKTKTRGFDPCLVNPKLPACKK